MNQGKLCLIFVAHIFIFAPSLIVILPFFFYYEELYALWEKEAAATEVLTVLFSIFLYFGPLFAFLYYFLFREGDDKEENKAGKRVRYALSKLRIPFFWGASIRDESSQTSKQKEKKKDVCAIVFFFTFLICLTAIFYFLVFPVMWDTNHLYQKDKIHLLNGAVSYKPVFDPSEESVYVTVSLDDYESSHYSVDDFSGLVTNSTALIEGPVIEMHEENRSIHTPEVPELSFAYTFAPGSSVYLKISTSTKMAVYYKKNDTVVKNRESLSEFELSFNETEFTSYLINISCPSSDAVLVSYDFVAKPMVFDMTNATFVRHEATFTLGHDDVLLLSRNSSYSSFEEYMNVRIQLRKSLFESLYNYQYIWIFTVMMICPIVVILEEMFTIGLIGSRTGKFTEGPISERKNMCKVLGHFNIMLLICGLLSFFATGWSVTDVNIENKMYRNANYSLQDSVYAGEQLIIELNESDNPGLTFSSTSDKVQLSLLSKFPDQLPTKTINCTPGPFFASSRWLATYYVTEGYSLAWMFESTEKVDVDLLYYNSVLHSDNDVKTSAYSYTAAATGLYFLSIKPSTETYITFSDVAVSAPEYAVNEVSVWNSSGDFSWKTFNSSEVKYLAIQPTVENSSSIGFKLTLFDFDDFLAASVSTGRFSSFMTIVCVILIFVQIVLMIFDLCGITLSLCYIGVNFRISYKEDLEDPLPQQSKTKQPSAPPAKVASGGYYSTPSGENNEGSALLSGDSTPLLSGGNESSHLTADSSLPPAYSAV